MLARSAGPDSGSRERRGFGRNSRVRGGRGSATYSANADSEVQCYRCHCHGDMSNVCPNPSSRVGTRKDVICFRCGKAGHIQVHCQEIVTRRPDSASTPAAQANTTVQPRATNASPAPTPKPYDAKRIAAFILTKIMSL